jgi:DNA-binding NarL/FixJ family response regulator
VFVALIDDHPLLSMGLAQGLIARGLDAVAVEPATAETLVCTLRRPSGYPDLAVVDLVMPAVPDTPQLVSELVGEGIDVLMLSGSDDHPELARCLLAGAVGILAKDESLEAIFETIEDVLAGRQIRVVQREERLQRYQQHCRNESERSAVFASMTQSEQEVLQAMMNGHGAATIAADRFVSVTTVRTQIKAVLAKLNSASQIEAIAKAHSNGFGDVVASSGFS